MDKPLVANEPWALIAQMAADGLSEDRPAREPQLSSAGWSSRRRRLRGWTAQKMRAVADRIEPATTPGRSAYQ